MYLHKYKYNLIWNPGLSSNVKSCSSNEYSKRNSSGKFSLGITLKHLILHEMNLRVFLVVQLEIIVRGVIWKSFKACRRRYRRSSILLSCPSHLRRSRTLQCEQCNAFRVENAHKWLLIPAILPLACTFTVHLRADKTSYGRHDMPDVMKSAGEKNAPILCNRQTNINFYSIKESNCWNLQALPDHWLKLNQHRSS